MHHTVVDECVPTPDSVFVFLVDRPQTTSNVTDPPLQESSFRVLIIVIIIVSILIIH